MLENKRYLIYPVYYLLRNGGKKVSLTDDFVSFLNRTISPNEKLFKCIFGHFPYRPFYGIKFGYGAGNKENIHFQD